VSRRRADAAGADDARRPDRASEKIGNHSPVSPVIMAACALRGIRRSHSVAVIRSQLQANGGRREQTCVRDSRRSDACLRSRRSRHSRRAPFRSQPTRKRAVPSGFHARSVDSDASSRPDPMIRPVAVALQSPPWQSVLVPFVSPNLPERLGFQIGPSFPRESIPTADSIWARAEASLAACNRRGSGESVPAGNVSGSDRHDGESDYGNALASVSTGTNIRRAGRRRARADPAASWRATVSAGAEAGCSASRRFITTRIRP